MAISFAKTTLTALEALIDRALAKALAPVREDIAALSKRLDQPATPAQPEPEPGAPSVGPEYVIRLSSSGAMWEYSTKGKSPVVRGLAQRHEVPVSSSVAGVGSLRLVLDVYPSGWAEAVFRNDGAMILDGGKATMALIALRDGVEVIRADTFSIGHYQARSFLLGKPVYPEMPSSEDLIKKGLVAPYALGPVAENRLADMAKAVASSDWNKPGYSRNITQYMPGTGGRADIGPSPEPQSVFLMTRDNRALDFVIGQAEAAMNIPWHMYDAKNGSWLSALDYPKLWTDGRGGADRKPGDAGYPKAGNRNSEGLTQSIPGDTGWTLDSAHQPSPCFIPYLLTGRESFRDEVLAQGAWNILNTWTATRAPDGLIVVDGGQVRHSAWALRQIEEAKVVALPGSAEAKLFLAASDANWAWLVSKIPTWTTAQGEAAGWLPGDYGGGALGLWQQAYFVSTAAAAARRGNKDATTFLRWMSGFFKGAVKNLGHDSCAYLIAIMEPDNKTPLRTWAAIKAETVARGWSNGDGWKKSEGDYAQLTVMALRLMYHTLGDDETRAMADGLIADGARFTDPATYLKDVAFRIAS